ncbi:fibronectin type III domain-containing protein [Flavobacterium sp. 3-210]
MGSLKSYYFGKRKVSANTYIGGVASVLNSASAVAAALSVSVSRIQNFLIVGSNIQFKMVGTYSLSFVPATGALLRPLLTYYQDNDGLVLNITSSCFAVYTKIIRLYFPGIITQTGTNVHQDIATVHILELPNCISLPANFLGNWQTPVGGGTKVLVAPKCTNWGATKLDNNVVGGNARIRMKAYAPISEQTSNAGAPEGDLSGIAGSTSSSVVYVPNYIKPNAIIDLTAGIITSTTIQLNFTVPSSTNTLDFYEVYLNSVYKGKITASGQNVTGLTTGSLYKIEVYAVDVYYNKSLISNIISVTTL